MLKKIKLLNKLVPLLALGLVIYGWKVLGEKGSAHKWAPDSSKAPPETELWFVTKVLDGDTITVRQTDGQEMKVRLCGIDAPERSQPLGNESKANLQKLVDEADNVVMVSVIEKDKYGRAVSEVWTSTKTPDLEKSLNAEQLIAGMAYLYKQYVSNCPNKMAFENAEEIAIGQSSGVWTNPNAIKPWDWRKSHK